MEPPTAVYTPDSPLRAPGRLVRDMWRDLLASRELAWRLVLRDIRARYRQSVLGVAWAFLPPLLMAGTFILLNSEGVIDVGETGVPYPVFVLCGTILWQVFLGALNAPLLVVASSKAMLTKINFPREALILAGIGHVVFDLLVKGVILAAVFAWFRLPVYPSVVGALAAILVLVLLGIAIGLLLTPLGILYTDVASFVTTASAIWFFLTPVVYPAPTSGVLGRVVAWNPVTPPLEAARDLLLRGGVADPLPLLAVSAATIVSLFGVWILYRVSLTILVERMGG